MNTLQAAPYQQHYIAPGDTHQPVAISSSQTQHPHPDTLWPSLLSLNAISALYQIEHQPNGDDQPMTDAQRENVEKTREVALQFYKGISTGELRLDNKEESEDIHYKQIITVPKQRSVYAELTVRVRLNEQAEYDLVGIDRHVLSSGEHISIVVPGPPQPANTHAPTPQRARPVSAHDARGQQVQARIEQNISTAGAETFKPNKCSHDPGGVIDLTTFKGCGSTDDELESADYQKAAGRVRRRKSRYNKAMTLGATSFAELRRIEVDERAASKGKSRQVLDKEDKDNAAIKKGLVNRMHAYDTQLKDRAAQAGFKDVKAYLTESLNKLAVKKGFENHQELKADYDKGRKR